MHTFEILFENLKKLENNDKNGSLPMFNQLLKLKHYILVFNKNSQ